MISEINVIMMFILWTRKLRFRQVENLIIEAVRVRDISPSKPALRNFTLNPYTMLLLLKMASLWLLSQAEAAALLLTSLAWPGCHDRIKQLFWLKQQKFIFLQFWRLQLQDSKVPAELVSGEVSFLGLQIAAFCNFTW